MSSDSSFVHLHVHTEYSMLDGAALLDPLFERTAELGMPAIAMTDHGNVHGAYDFYAKAREAGVKPIIGCLLRGQEIYTSTGVKPVEEVEVGDRVLTHKGRFRRVLRTMSRPYSGRGFTISLAGRYGRTLTLTEEHPVLVRTRDGLVDWRKPADITAGRPGVRAGSANWNSWVCLPKLEDSVSVIELLSLLPPDFSADETQGLTRAYSSKFRGAQRWPDVPAELSLDDELAYFLGLYAAEGSIAKRNGKPTGAVMFSLHARETELAARVESVARRFGAGVSRYSPQGRANSLEVHLRSVPIAYMVSALVGCSAKSKRVPSEIVSASSSVRKAFLEGLLDGDGKRRDAPYNKTQKRDLKVTSRDLAWGARTLLADLGHWASVSHGVSRGDFPQGPSPDAYEWFMLSYSPNRQFSYSCEDSQYTYRPISDVTELHLETEVFNFEVEEDNSYVSDFVLHNCEAYLTPGTHRGEKKRVQWNKGGDDDVSGNGAYTHMTLLAENTEGMHNLFRLSSRSSLEGYYYKPRADRELLREYASGLIGTTGCPSGEIQTWLRIGNYENARASAAEFQDIFGKENFYLELMDHDLGIEKRVREGLLQLRRDLDLPVIATNDSHYVAPEDAEAHDALLCVGTATTLSDSKRFRLEGGGYYIKSAEEMRSLWEDKHDLKEACDNTLLIAERCDIEFNESNGGYMARADVPAGHTEESWFVEEVWRGIEHRYGASPSDDVRARTEMELQVIRDKGYCGYYLVVADFINWAKDRGIRVGPGRGSGAGSIAAYALRITDLCPLQHGLIFERFLNPERPSMPDFDIDFDERRRSEVIQYVSEKYGSDRVAMIATFGRLKSKAAIKDANRVLDYPFGMGEKITKALPPDVMGKGVALKELFDSTHKRYSDGRDFRELHETDAEVRKIYDTAVGLEGQIRQWGVHAAGVIMSSEPLIDIVPIMKREQDGAIITQFDYPMCEALGLVKMDFLGLRNLTVLDDAVDNIKANRGTDLVLEDLPFDDPATYALLGRGDTLGVFQLDGGPMRQLLRAMQPDNFEDISAVIALYRPGPMGADSHTNYAKRKTGKQEITPIHPELAGPLEKVLGSTYGLIVYQEQVMQIAQDLAGFTLGQADNLRRAMGKKKAEILQKEYVPFSEGMAAHGHSPQATKALWDVLVPFADYAFNKAHSASYGVLSYWTAYLKANYPAEFMAALLTSVKGDKDKSAIYLNECRRLGIQVLPPDVNESSSNFTSVDDDIRFGLSAVRNVGDNVVAGIVSGREEGGPYTNFTDFLEKVPAIVCNKRVLDSLIKAGAFDSLGHQRRALTTIAEDAVDVYIDLKRNAAIGQDSLFGGMDDELTGVSVTVPTMPEWEKTQLLAFERDMLGLYVSDHPLLGLEHVLKASSDCTIGQLLTDMERPDGSTVRICGLITSVQRKLSRKGDTWATVTVEDLEGAIDVLVFPAAYQLAAPALLPDTIVVVKARLRRTDDGLDVSAVEITVPSMASGATAGPIVVSLPVARCTSDVVNRFKQVLAAHPGVAEVHLRLVGNEGTKVMRLDDGLRVKPSSSLIADLKELLGPDCLA